MSLDEVTLGEILRRMISLESKWDRATAQFVSRELYEKEVTGLRGQIEDLEDSNSFFIKTVMGNFITILIMGSVLAWAILR